MCRKVVIRAVPFFISVLVAGVLLLTGACNGLGEGTTHIYASQIEVEYPEGMTVDNGATIRFKLVNQSIYCIKIPVEDSFPVFVYLQDGSAVQVRNTRTYINPIFKLNVVTTLNSRKNIEVTPELPVGDEKFNQSLFKAYILIEGSDCGDPSVAVAKKIPFFIRYYTDY